MVKKRVSSTKKEMTDLSSGDAKKATASQRKKASKMPKVMKKEDLVEQMHKHKKGVQEMRFGLSKEGQQKGDSRQNLRKQIARTATQLTALRKNDGVRA